MKQYEKILKNIESKDFKKAEEICNEIQNLSNDHIALNLLGLTQIKQNKFKLAEKNFIKSCLINDVFEPAIKNLYLLYLKQKKISKMLYFAKKLINLNNNNPAYNYFLGLAFELNHLYDDAIKLYKKSIDLNYIEKRNALNNIGNILLTTKKPEESIHYFKKAHELDTENIYVIYNLLSNYAELRDINNLETGLKTYKLIEKDLKTYFYYKAELLILKNQTNEAKELLEKNLDDVRFAVKLIRLNFTTGNYEDAKQLFFKIKNKLYDDSNYSNFLATTFLFEGDFEQGWKFYDKRISKINSKYFNIKEWRGENLTDKKILVFSEQGLGDTIQFSKYLISLLKISNNVTFLVQKKILDIFRKDIKGLTIMPIENFEKKNFDFKIDLGSLIKFFYKDKINNQVEILNARDDNEVTKLVKIDRSKMNVGIAWSGSFYGPNEPYRSLNLIDLEKLFELDVNYYCLQNEIRNSDLNYFQSLNLTDCGNFNLVQIGEIINNLDLVITVDTSILHLSASLDKETWALLNLYPDWRWNEFQKFHTYNSLKLFRQKRFNIWSDIIDDIYNELKIKLIKD